MANHTVEFRRVPIAPVNCLESAWGLIKDQYWLFLGMCLLAMLIGGAVPLGILLGPMMCGIDMCYLKKMRGETVRFELLFRGFDHFVESLIATLIVFAVMILAMIPLYALWCGGFVTVITGAEHGQQSPAPALLVVLAMMLLLCFVAALVLVALSVLFTFSYMLIVDKGLGGAAAVKTSVKAAWANVWGLVGLALLNWLLSVLGAMCCYVGAIFVLPLTLGASVVAYRKVFPAGPPMAIPVAAAA